MGTHRSSEKLLHLLADFGRLAGAFGRQRPGVADFAQGEADGEPIDAALAERAEAVAAREGQIVILYMYAGDSSAKRANPVLRIAEGHDVTDVEAAGDVRGVGGINEVGEFDGREQEAVPDVFEGEGDTASVGFVAEFGQRFVDGSQGVDVSDLHGGIGGPSDDGGDDDDCA